MPVLAWINGLLKAFDTQNSKINKKKQGIRLGKPQALPDLIFTNLDAVSRTSHEQLRQQLAFAIQEQETLRELLRKAQENEHKQKKCIECYEQGIVALRSIIEQFRSI